MSATVIAGIEVPSSSLIRDVTELVQSSAPPLLYHHSRRVFLVGGDRAAHDAGGNADVLSHYLPGFERGDFVETILASDWAD
jgi:hypothetical protein